MTDRPGYEDDFEYFAENRTVRVVTSRGAHTGYATWSFEKWASFEASKVALERVREVAADRLGHDEFGSGIGRPPSATGTTFELVVDVYVVDRGGMEPPPSAADRLDRLVEAAPREVDVAITLEGAEYSRSVPVYADHLVVRTL